MLSFVTVAHAQIASPGMVEAHAFVTKVNEIILYPLITLLMAIALFIFMFGCYQYVTHSYESEAREDGRMHILWGIIGMFIMLVAYGVLSIAAGTFGLRDELDCANDPLDPACATTQFYDAGNLSECLTGGGC
jgi:fructose-specific phosphotransferase system IIC component